MTLNFDQNTKRVNLEMTVAEFDMLMTLRYAAGNFIAPLNPDSELGQFVRELNHAHSDLVVLGKMRS